MYMFAELQLAAKTFQLQIANVDELSRSNLPRRELLMDTWLRPVWQLMCKATNTPFKMHAALIRRLDSAEEIDIWSNPVAHLIVRKMGQVRRLRGVQKGTVVYCTFINSYKHPKSIRLDDNTFGLDVTQLPKLRLQFVTSQSQPPFQCFVKAIVLKGGTLFVEVGSLTLEANVPIWPQVSHVALSFLFSCKLV